MKKLRRKTMKLNKNGVIIVHKVNENAQPGQVHKHRISIFCLQLGQSPTNDQLTQIRQVSVELNYFNRILTRKINNIGKRNTSSFFNEINLEVKVKRR